MLKEYRPSEIEFLKVHGRTTKTMDPVTLFWTGSGVEMNIRATEVRIRYHADYDMFEPWIDVVIGGVRYQKLPIEKGTHELSVWRGAITPPGQELPLRNIRIIRDTPAMPGDRSTVLQIEAILTDGVFEQVEEPGLRIEFIGDSITSGEGCMGPFEEQDWNSACFDAVNNYAYMTAKKLGADYESFSQSGYGYMWSWYGNSMESMPRFYDKVCGLLPEGKASEPGAHDDYDFSDFVPDVVVINLGTNDVGAFTDAGHDSARAMNFENPHYPDDNDEIPSDDVEILRKGAIDFLIHLREKRPNAKLIWAYGMLCQDSEARDRQMPKILEGAVKEYSEMANDRDVYYVQLPPTLEGEFGSRSHPGYLSHKKTAEVLADMIEDLMK